MNSTIKKQFPASTISCSIYDVTSLDTSHSRPENTRELGKRRSLMHNINRTGTFHNRLSIQSPKYKGETDMNTTAEGVRLSTVHDSIFSHGSADVEGPQTATNARLHKVTLDDPSWATFRIRRHSQTVRSKGLI